MNAELLNKLRHLANMAAHLPYDVTLEDEDAAMRALHSELAADTVLELIALAERTTAQDEVLTKIPRFNIDVDVGGDDIQEVPYPTGDFCRFEDVQALLAAAAPSPAVAPEPKRQMFMDEIDAAKAGSEWLKPFFVPGFRLSFSVDEYARAPKAKWCMLFDSLDRVLAGYMLTRDAKNWTELTKIGPSATPSPSLAVPDIPREPTSEMMEAANRQREVGGDTKDCWRAMWDAAMREKP